MSRSTPTQPIIYLIAEDKTGEYVFQEILRKKGLITRVEPRGAAVGVSTLAKEIKGLIATLLKQISDADCIVVLHDADLSVQSYRADYERIQQICDNYRTRVTRLEATQEIESWLLADDGFCQWLDRTPRGSDHVPQPSKVVEGLINNRYGRSMWTNKNKPKILQQHMNVTGEPRSESMRIAMQLIHALPCISST